MTQVDFNILSDPSHKNFQDQVENARAIVDPKNVEKYFEVATSQLTSKKKIPLSSGKSLLISMITILQNSANREVFLNNEFILQLPYDNKDYADLIFDLYFTLVSQDPDFFDEHIKDKFQQIIKFNPEKALVIIAKYGEKFGSMENPWDVLDLLFYQAEHFYGEETIINYISLLTYLCRKKNDYNVYRSTKCFLKLSNLLGYRDPDVIKAIYGALISISNNSAKCKTSDIVSKLPIDLIVGNLQSDNVEIRNAAMQFLLIYELSNEKILQQLLDMKDKKATLILMKYSENQKAAMFLANNDKWMKTPLPNITESLKLVYCILNHRSVRKKVSSSQNLTTFLILASKDAGQVELTLILGIFKQLSLSQQKISELEKKQFFKNIVRSADKCNCEQTDQVRYNIFEIASQYKYTREMSGVCKCAVTEIIENESLSEEAYNLLLVLCKYPECVKIMKNDGLVDYYSKRTKNSKIKRQAQKLLALIPPDDDEEYYDYSA